MEQIRENRKSETKEYSKMAALRNFTRREKKLGADGGNKVQKSFKIKTILLFVLC